MLYAFLAARYRAHGARSTPPVHLPADTDDEHDEHTPLAAASDDTERAPKDTLGAQPMHGWRYLLLWLPAACDLTGTTVSLSAFFC